MYNFCIQQWKVETLAGSLKWTFGLFAFLTLGIVGNGAAVQPSNLDRKIEQISENLDRQKSFAFLLQPEQNGCEILYSYQSHTDNDIYYVEKFNLRDFARYKAKEVTKPSLVVYTEEDMPSVYSALYRLSNKETYQPYYTNSVYFLFVDDERRALATKALERAIAICKNR